MKTNETEKTYEIRRAQQGLLRRDSAPKNAGELLVVVKFPATFSDAECAEKLHAKYDSMRYDYKRVK